MFFQLAETAFGGIESLNKTTGGSSKKSESSGGSSKKSESSSRPHADLESNVYDFGILLLEIISGKLRHSEEQGSLVNWVSLKEISSGN